MDHVIFAIDNNTDNHVVAKFMRHIDTSWYMGGMRGNMVQCIGNWEGVLEVSYIMRKEDYIKLVLPFGFTEGQEAVMIAPRDQRQPASIVSYNLVEHMAELGPIKTIEPHEATPDVAWTFNTISGKYFTA